MRLRVNRLVGDNMYPAGSYNCIEIKAFLRNKGLNSAVIDNG